MSKNALLIVALVLINLNLFGQNFPFAVSENGEFFGRCTEVAKEDVKGTPFGFAISKPTVYEFRYFNVLNRTAILNFQFYATNIASVKITLSPDGKCIAINSDNSTMVVNAQSANLIFQSFGSKHVVFPYHDNSFLISTDKTLILYDSYAGKEIRSFSQPKFSKTYGDIWFSHDDKTIILQKAENKFSVWSTNNSKLKSIQSASSFGFDYQNNYVTFVKGLRTKTYSLKTMKLVFRNDAKSATRDFIKNKRLQDRESRIKLGNSILSNSGNFLLIPFTEAEIGGILVYSTQRNDLREFSLKDFDPFKEMSWLNDSMVILNHFNKTTTLLNLVDQENPRTVDFEYSKNTEVRNSKDFAYFIKPKRGQFKRGFELTNTENGTTFRSTDFEYFTLAQKVDLVVAQSKKENKIGVIDPIHTLENGKIVFYEFDHTIVPIVESIYVDEAAPEGYDPHKIKEFKHISELTDSSSLIRLILRNAEISDSTISINSHLIDENGIYYYGAGSDQWKHIWCNFLLKKSKGNFTQISDFEVIEHRSKSVISMATALVLDHSGSMGEERTYKMQKEVLAYITNKDEKDGITIIKFDDKIGIEVKTTANSKKLLKSLKPSGLDGYGGGTALLDGTNAAISILNKSDKFSGKIAIVITDGLENSSFMDKTELIKRARENDVQLFVVGYGTLVNKEYLKSLALPTNGSYYEIYNINDFEWIFQDIKHKAENYYEIKFKTDTIADHQTVLKVCITEKQKDTLGLSINNLPFEDRPDDVLDQDSTISYQQIIPTKELYNSTLIPDIEDFTTIRTSTATEPEQIVESMDLDDLTEKIESEFEEIKLPNIKFEHNSTVIIESSLVGIDEVRDFLLKYEEVVVEIAGHTDSEGEEYFNMELSKKRAEKVKEILVNKGIQNDRLITKGYGELFPLVKNNSEKNKQQNRRVEFSILE